FQAQDGIRDGHVTGVQTCALPISRSAGGCTPSPSEPTTSTATSTTPTSVPPSATSAPFTARAATPRLTFCRAKSSTRKSRKRLRSEERRVGKYGGERYVLGVAVCD